MPEPLRVVIAGGGTGGHLYPGIAVARELLARRPEARITFAGTAAGIEARVVPREGFELDTIRSAGLKGKSPLQLARGFATLPLSALDAWRVLSARAPHLVIGLGGYSSGPLVVLAAVRGVPTMLLEQNALPGVTNRLLARVVKAAAVTYEASLPYFEGKGFVSGNPVRPEFFRAQRGARAPVSSSAPAHVLVFGGSQGAHAINLAMVEAASGLAGRGDAIAIVHQTGPHDLEMVRHAYRRAGLVARTEAFLYEMPREMSEAELVVARAGATTLAELAAAGRPALLVPLPTATDDHQRKNAEVLALAAAAAVIDQREIGGGELGRRVLALLDDPDGLASMATAIAGFARPDAARVIVDRALELAQAGQGPG